MLLAVHMLFGAAAGATIQEPAGAFALAFATHYFLDSLPHREYEIPHIENIRAHSFSRALPDFLKIAADICAGIFMLWLLAPPQQTPLYLIALGMAAALPDAISFLHFLAPNNAILAAQKRFHKKIHIHPEKKETPWGLGIGAQIAVVFASLALILFPPF